MASHPLLDKINQRMQQLDQDGLLRKRNQTGVSSHIIDFSHNDYLGLATSAEMISALNQGANRYGVGSKASPLVSGYSQAHHDLEKHLCEVTGHEAGLLFCSGFSANQALLKTLVDGNDVVIADKLIHASMIDGVKDSGANLKRFKHNDLQHAEQLLTRHPESILLTESVFSMDGDKAPLAELKGLCQQYNTWLIVDDAHGFGVLAASSVSQYCDIQVVTFGKALGCQGAAILGSQAVIDYLVAQSRHYIYSTALSPANAYLALAAVKLTQSSSHRFNSLQDNIHYFKQACAQEKIDLTESETAIQPVIIGSSEQTVMVAEQLRAVGLLVGAIRQPTVPKGQARLRITLNSQHTKTQINQLVMALSRLIHPHN
ncbi:aminotransferase class I/II-fold pyridoxal phosphate-dependent enzyme [Shewanella japonica]|uniref:8-amino-7-oxononanoate synthase n=1 Tax=Shewanella japonica TaxID=93973 RepID=A0ABM6JID4_9GAMM|nr:8-amino-7-oxononanoate synthase [Shewanella japonica]ARD21994.1 8-amino-7-oxononanoate synthase [Shewanella japonica]